MLSAPEIPQDAQRCMDLRALQILDTPSEERFDRITRLARQLFDVEIVLISLVDEDRQWFKSRQGLDVVETPRAISFCGHAVASDSVFVIEDTALDDRFADNPLVLGAPNIRFYAGQPLRAPTGQLVGTLCLIDSKPREFDGEARNRLRDLALLVEAEFRRRPRRAGTHGDPSERRRRPHWRHMETLWNRLAARFSQRSWALVPALVVAGAILLGGMTWERQQLKAYRSSVEKATLQRLSLVRGAVESALNSKLHLVHGLSGYVRAGGRIDEANFARFAAELAEGVGSVRSLQLAPDGVVRYAWPLATNRKAIGHDLLGDGTRRAAAERAIAERKLWLAGPLKLLQGGEALIGRLPIFVDTTEAEAFWGFATILIDLPGLWAETRMKARDDRYDYAIRGRDALGSAGEAFFGDRALFGQSPVTGLITLPAGSWEIAMQPRGGWPRSWPGEASFRLGVVFVALLVGLLVYFLLRLPNSLRRAIAEATSALERSESQFRDAIEALPDGFVIFDASDRLVVCNERFRDLYRPCRPRLQQGRRFAEVFRYGAQNGLLRDLDCSSADAVQQAVQVAVERHQDCRDSHEHDLADGRTVRVVERRMHDGGIVSFHMDVSVEKAGQRALVEARERAEQANQAKSAFLATVSHEVRTPLNGVLGLLSVLREDALLNEQQSGYVATAHRSAQHLLQILNEILDLSKLEADKLELDVGRFVLRDTLEGAVELVAAQARAKSLDLRTEIGDSLHRAVLGDEGRLRQILLNLLSNAVKFTDSGAVVLRADGSESANGRLAIRIEVQDSGIGFDQEQAERLFEAFAQLDSDADRRFTGTGLGLTICKRLVELMNGRIAARGEPGKGAVFSLELEFPLAGELSEREIEDVDPPLPAELGWPAVRILLAEDSPTNQLVIQAMLQNTGYQVDAVHDGREAVESVRRLPYDLILMDVYMPELDGLAATRAIREDATVPRLPIVALTANAMEGDSERFLEAGMDDYLPKPVDRRKLLATLYRWCRDGRPATAVAAAAATPEED